MIVLFTLVLLCTCNLVIGKTADVDFREVAMRLLAYEYDLSGLSGCSVTEERFFGLFKSPQPFISSVTCQLRTRSDIGVFTVEVDVNKYDIGPGGQMIVADQQGVRDFNSSGIPKKFVLFAPFYFLYGGAAQEAGGFEFKLTKTYKACESQRMLLPGEHPIMLYNKGEPNRHSGANEFCELRLRSYMKNYTVKATIVYASLKAEGKLMINTRGPETPHYGTALEVLTNEVSDKTYMSINNVMSFYYESGIEDGSIFLIAASAVPDTKQ